MKLTHAELEPTEDGTLSELIADIMERYCAAAPSLMDTFPYVYPQLTFYTKADGHIYRWTMEEVVVQWGEKQALSHPPLETEGEST